MISKFNMQTIKIKNLGRVITGSTPPTKNREYYGDEYLFIKPSDISPSIRRVTTSETMLSSQGYENQKRRVLPRNTTCVVCIGTIGKLCLTSEPSFTNQQINSVIVDEERFDPLYVFYLLSTVIPKVQKIEGGSASGREHVNKTNFEGIEINVHSLSIQRKIAAVLSAYDDLIENNIRRIQILEDMAQAIYRQWFVEFQYPGHEGVPLVDSGTELCEIPQGWEVKTLGEICVIARERFVDEFHSTLPLLNMARMNSNTLYIDGVGRPDELSTSRIIFREDDVLFGSIRPYLHKVALAPCLGVTNTSVLVLRGINAIYKAILPILLSSEASVRWADQNSTGTKMPVIKWENFKSMLVVVPPRYLLYEFNQLLNPVLGTIKLGFNRNRNLRATRDLLLPRLVSGEVDVSGLEMEGKEE